MKILLLFTILLIQNLFAQNIDNRDKSKIIDFFHKREYKACVDEGVVFFEKNGNDSLKIYINRAKAKLLNYSANNLDKVEEDINNAIRLSPNLIPNYAIYAGLAEVSFWMMYKNTLPLQDKSDIMDFSLQLFDKALGYIPNDSLLVKGMIYYKSSELLSFYGAKIEAKRRLKLAYSCFPDNYGIGIKVAKYYEEEGEIDSCEEVLTSIFRSNNQTDAQTLNEFIGDNVQDYNLKVKYYEEALDYAPRNQAGLYKKIANAYYFNDYSLAIEYFKKFLNIQPGDDDVLKDVGFLYGLLGDNNNAIKYYSKIKNWETLNTWDYTFYARNFAECYYENGEINNALKNYKISKDPSGIAKCYYDLSDYESAIKYIKEDINKDISTNYVSKDLKNWSIAYSYSRLGKCYANLNDRINAFYSFEKACHYDDTNSDSKYNLELYRILKDNPDWDLVCTTNESAVLYNKQRIEKNSTNTFAWLKNVLFPGSGSIETARQSFIEKRNLDTEKYKSFEYSLAYYGFDCLHKKLRAMDLIYYEGSGNVIERISLDEPTWENAIPESVGEVMLEAVCKLGKK